jgi:hypothetical protein
MASRLAVDGWHHDLQNQVLTDSEQKLCLSYWVMKRVVDIAMLID